MADDTTRLRPLYIFSALFSLKHRPKSLVTDRPAELLAMKSTYVPIYFQALKRTIRRFCTYFEKRHRANSEAH